MKTNAATGFESMLRNSERLAKQAAAVGEGFLVYLVGMVVEECRSRLREQPKTLRTSARGAVPTSRRSRRPKVRLPSENHA